MSIVPAKACISTVIRFSPDLHKRLKESAAWNYRSFNSEINLLLEKALGQAQGNGIIDDIRIMREVAVRIEAHALQRKESLPMKMTAGDFHKLTPGEEQE